jgi:hypothetical protein
MADNPVLKNMRATITPMQEATLRAVTNLAAVVLLGAWS